MKYLKQSNLISLIMGFIVILGLATAAVEAMPWASKAQVKTNADAIALLIRYSKQEQDWYNDFRERLARIEESGKNISKDLAEIKSDFKEHQRNHHN